MAEEITLMSEQQNSDSVPHSYTVKIIKKALPKTVKMVDDALIELHTRNGVTLNKLLSFIAGKYVITLTNHRKVLIKKHLKELIRSEDLINITGKGLLGHFKLAKKKKSVNNEMKKRNSQSRKTSEGKQRPKVVTKKTSTLMDSESVPTPTLELTPTSSKFSIIPTDCRTKENFKSMFDTPLSSNKSTLPAKKRFSGRRI